MKLLKYCNQSHQFSPKQVYLALLVVYSMATTALKEGCLHGFVPNLTILSLYMSSLGVTKSSEAPQLHFLLPVLKYDTHKREHWLHFCLEEKFCQEFVTLLPRDIDLPQGSHGISLPRRETAALCMPEKWRCTFWVCSIQYILSPY